MTAPKRDFAYITMSLEADPRPYSFSPQGCTGGSDEVKPQELIFSEWREVACHKLLAELSSALPWARAGLPLVLLFSVWEDHLPVS